MRKACDILFQFVFPVISCILCCIGKSILIISIGVILLILNLLYTGFKDYRDDKENRWTSHRMDEYDKELGIKYDGDGKITDLKIDGGTY